MNLNEELTFKEAVNYLKVPEKHFRNYWLIGREMNGFKKNGRWFFKKSELDRWKKIKDEHSILLSLNEYEECFELAIKMAYSSKGGYGTGIRGARSEMQIADDWILGILAEYAFRKFLIEKFGKVILLDTEAHPGRITEQDIQEIMEYGKARKPRINVAIKASKFKNCYLIIPQLEYENENRKSDIYIFARVDLPSDHLFRILRDHSFFKKAKDFLEKDDRFREIEELKEVKVWICGFAYHKDLEKISEIPGQKFNGYRYVKKVGELKNSAEDWDKFTKML